MGANLEVEMLQGSLSKISEFFEFTLEKAQSGLKENVKVGFTTSEHKPIRKTLVL